MTQQIVGFSGDYDWLSNFFPYAVQLDDDGQWYPTVEHAYQASKMVWYPTVFPAKSFEYRVSIAHAPTPGRAKQLGRRALLRADWENVKDQVMLSLLRQKFGVGSFLREILKATRDAELVEGNFWHDNYWGVCFCARCCTTIASNRLGELLMQVRKECY